MKIRLLIILSLMILFSGCSSDNYPDLMPNKHGDYSVLWIKDNGGGYNEYPLVFNKVNKVTSIISLEEAKDEYPKLSLIKQPAFIIFNENGIVLKTYIKEEAIEFLEENYNDK
ncbi:hypothetical protein GLW08_16535 [Pontibacillus yanchengensis]|uniref:Uncharacterized protein n=2 Tax=Pontibacillus yanchengensis TaxID=462910 RepID=A0ACC7VHL0_9BACI|nr:hypothetical protein [Pontibacillus yanchengensis]MYL35661.1 hypothetical protein [Pontibacillus yanchengensis]MYL54943.1 hypothetical protein [Pontibacillus yanchengensis]